MLTELSISNFAIIEQQRISFIPGLNVISGETGAGKSIILHAIELILGGRPRPHVLRAGAESAEVEALFNLSTLSEKALAELPDMARGEELVISRTISAQGRGKVYINGRLGTVALLEEIVSKFVNICGQNQHVRLLDASYHRELLDSYAANEALFGRYAEAFNAWKEAAAQVQELENASARNVLRRAELEALVEDLKAVELRPGIRVELEGTAKRLGNSESLVNGTQQLLEALNDEQGLFTQLERSAGELRGLERLDPRVAELSAQFNAGKAEIEEFERELKRYTSAIEVNEEALSTLREHLADVARLERKYRTNDAGLCELLERSSRELGMLDGTIDIEALRADVTRKKEKAGALAAELTRVREKAGKEISKIVERELIELSMGGAKLAVEITPKELCADGADTLQFLISPNKGEPARPLRQIASGGELSRIMLVLKKVLKERTGVNVLVFDEVDTGISGAVARAVGEKLKELSDGSQVICITHLPQVASLADSHILVEKREVSPGRGAAKRTVSIIRELSADERVDEVARMIAGHEITKASRESARELLGQGKR